MYSKRTGLILAFHGCDRNVVDEVIAGKTSLNQSTNKYDWLGHGIYFWDNSPSRALEYAMFLRNNPERSRSKVKNPAVIGAVLNLGFCLDLLDYENLSFVKLGYEIPQTLNASTQNKVPENRAIGNNRDLLLRELDCAVLQSLHTLREESQLDAFDSVRGVFWEGDLLYPNAGFREKDHIQICVRNPNCIKGYFLPRDENEDFNKV
jgi:hypothetical protein